MKGGIPLFMLVYIMLIMRRGFRIDSLTPSALQMMTKRSFIDPQRPGISADPVGLDASFQDVQRYDPKF